MGFNGFKILLTEIKWSDAVYFWIGILSLIKSWEGFLQYLEVLKSDCSQIWDSKKTLSVFEGDEVEVPPKEYRISKKNGKWKKPFFLFILMLRFPNTGIYYSKL